MVLPLLSLLRLVSVASDRAEDEVEEEGAEEKEDEDDDDDDEEEEEEGAMEFADTCWYAGMKAREVALTCSPPVCARACARLVNVCGVYMCV
jgi:ABC-type Zn2+ transport system substrate-binding protein/surface adhesin